MSDLLNPWTHQLLTFVAMMVVIFLLGQSEWPRNISERLSSSWAVWLGLAVLGCFSRCELKDLDIPENMQRTIAKEADAVREKRSRIIKGVSWKRRTS